MQVKNIEKNTEHAQQVNLIKVKFKNESSFQQLPRRKHYGITKTSSLHEVQLGSSSGSSGGGIHTVDHTCMKSCCTGGLGGMTSPLLPLEGLAGGTLDPTPGTGRPGGGAAVTCGASGSAETETAALVTRDIPVRRAGCILFQSRTPSS